MYAARAPLRQSVCIYLRYGSICIAALIHCCNNTHTHTPRHTPMHTDYQQRDDRRAVCEYTGTKSTAARRGQRRCAAGRHIDRCCCCCCYVFPPLLSLVFVVGSLSLPLCPLSLTLRVRRLQKKENEREVRDVFRACVYFFLSFSHSLTHLRALSSVGGGGSRNE